MFSYMHITLTPDEALFLRKYPSSKPSGKSVQGQPESWDLDQIIQALWAPEVQGNKELFRSVTVEVQGAPPNSEELIRCESEQDARDQRARMWKEDHQRRVRTGMMTYRVYRWPDLPSHNTVIQVESADGWIFFKRHLSSLLYEGAVIGPEAIDQEYADHMIRELSLEDHKDAFAAVEEEE
jgi:hypothetical protein